MRTASSLQLLILGLFLGCGLTLEAKWIVAEQGSLTVYSQLSKRQTRDLLEELHLLREGLRLMFPNLEDDLDLDLEEPIHLLLPNDKAIHASLLPLFLGKPKPAGGLFSQGPLYDLLWVDGRRSYESIRTTLFHEFVHALLRGSQTLPLAVQEGLAEVISSARFEDGKMILGEPEWDRLRRLSIADPVPLAVLLKTGHRDTAYNHVEEIGDFYDQAWLMMQYILCGSSSKAEKALFWRILGQLESGSRMDSHFQQIVAGLGQIDRGKQAYLKKGDFKVVLLNVSDLPPPGKWDFRRAGKAEIRPVLAGAQVMVARIEEAEESLVQLAKKYPASVHVYRELINLAACLADSEAVQKTINAATAQGITTGTLFDRCKLRIPENSGLHGAK